MKWPVTSLYLLVFITLFGFGSVIDQVYSRHFNPETEENESFRIVFESVLNSINLSIPSGSAELVKPKMGLPDLFELDPIETFVLPESLAAELSQGKLIILDSQSGISLHQRVMSKDLILSFGPLPGTSVDVNRSLAEYILTLTFYLGIALVLVLWVRPLIRDVQQLSKLAKRLGSGELDARLPNNTQFLSELFSDYNRMAERLQELSNDNQLFSQAVSHDLRTPLARIEFGLEKVNQEPVSENQTEAIEKISKDLSQIENLSSELLDYARLGQTRELNLEAVDLHVFIHQAIAEFETTSYTIDYFHQVEVALIVSIDTALFQKLIRNLLGNAVKFSHSQIRISTACQNQTLTIAIEDDGDGIDGDLEKRLFLPFVKGGSDHKNQFGLGLAICERVMKLHQGTIKADNHSVIGGARFTLELPI